MTTGRIQVMNKGSLRGSLHGCKESPEHVITGSIFQAVNFGTLLVQSYLGAGNNSQQT